MARIDALLRWLSSQIVTDVPPEIHACEHCREVDCSPERMQACALRAEAESAERQRRGLAPLPDPAAASTVRRVGEEGATAHREAGNTPTAGVEGEVEDLPQESEQQVSHIRPRRDRDDERGGFSVAGAGLTRRQ